VAAEQARDQAKLAELQEKQKDEKRKKEA